MSKKYKKYVRDSFEFKIGSLFPDFKKLQSKSEYVFPGNSVYTIPTNDTHIMGFLMLVPDCKGRDQFTLEIGWSTKSRFPELNMTPSGDASRERTEFNQDEFICRLSCLWSLDNDYWWGQDRPGGSRFLFSKAGLASGTGTGTDRVISEIIKSSANTDDVNFQKQIVGYVDDAVKQFAQYGLSYLDEFFASRQVKRLSP